MRSSQKKNRAGESALRRGGGIKARGRGPRPLSASPECPSALRQFFQRIPQGYPATFHHECVDAQISMAEMLAQ
jgi:hypothetical protein